jgi:hypothetical protein
MFSKRLLTTLQQALPQHILYLGIRAKVLAITSSILRAHDVFKNF